jgi:CBS domain-containing protein
MYKNCRNPDLVTSMRADQIMTPLVVTVGPDTSIFEAAKKMLRHHISGLPVVNAADELIGIISQGDFIISQGDFIRRAEIGTERKRRRWLEFLLGSDKTAADFVREQGRKVGEIMTPHPHTISEATPLEKIVEIMESENLRRLPVLRGNRLVGIVTRSNLVQAVASLAPDVPIPTIDDDRIRSSIIAAIADESWSPCRLGVIVRDGTVTLSGIVMSEHSRRASIVAAENVPGVKKVNDHLRMMPPPEEELGGGDIASLQEQPPTIDDEPL